jgi:signal transduction histidine kinase
MDALIQRNRTHIFFSTGVMMTIGLIAIWLFYRNQKHHLIKLQEMGARLHQAERLSSLGHLAAGVAHEIRNPLNAIGMAAQRIQRECNRADDGKDNDLMQFTGLIRDEIRRLNGIVEDFLGLSRSRFELRFQSIVELLESLVHLIREEADSLKIRIETHWEATNPIIYMDADKMKQALLNIIKNAFESMTGPGTLGIRVGPYTKKYLRIHISDTGSGIPPDMQKEMFNPHFTTKDNGLGLGLPIAYEIIRAHGGEIRVHSEPGRGSVFEILLPRERKPNEESGDTGRRG